MSSWREAQEQGANAERLPARRLMPRAVHEQSLQPSEDLSVSPIASARSASHDVTGTRRCAPPVVDTHAALAS
jgi:hypothetical protein